MEFTEHCVEDGLQMFDSKFFNKNTPEIVLFSNPFYGNFATGNIKPMIEGRFMYRIVITLCSLSMHLYIFFLMFPFLLILCQRLFYLKILKNFVNNNKCNTITINNSQ